MDETDCRILEVLQRDGSLTNAALAERVHLSPSTCLRRVQRLRERGVIERVVAIVSPEKVGRGLTALVEISLAHHGSEARSEFLDRLRREPPVLKAHLITGQADVFLLLQLADMREYQTLCDRLFNHDPIVEKFYTSFAMDTYKDETALPTDRIADNPFRGA